MKFALLSTFAFVITQVLAKPAPGCLQNYTVVATDTCTSLIARFNLIDMDFYVMNPGLHHNQAHDCDNLDTGKPFCVCMKAPCATGAPNPYASALQPSSAHISNSSLYPSASGYRPALPSASLLHPPMASGHPAAALPSMHPPSNMNNVMMSSSQNPPVSNTLRVSGTATGIINAQASHFGANSASLQTVFGTMTASFIIISTLLSL